ncbi:MAG: hypothetical protein SFV53_05085 [Rickettsiales bacterium]|nr:hypothetical protein [Rickettsiales bacterium]
MKKNLCKICVVATTAEICKKCASYKKSPQKVLGDKVLFAELEKYRGKFEYDCIVAFSGGKDSSYVLHLLKKKYNLKILAVTGEDYIASKQAWKNRFEVVKKLGVDHLIIRYDWQLYRQVYKHAILSAGMRPRAINLVHNLMHEKAIFECLDKYQVPLLITGNSDDELEFFKQWQEKLGFVSTNNYAFDYWNNWRNSYIKVLTEILPKEMQEKIPEIVWKKPCETGNYATTRHLPLFKYEPFDVNYNLKIIKKELGWKMPNDVGGTETDSAGLQFDVIVFRKLHGEAKYAEAISNLIRCGAITRQIALKAINYRDEKIVKDFFKDFDLSWQNLNPQKCSPFLSKWLDLFLPIR